MDMDLWHGPERFGPSTLDLFDPFDELDHMISRNLSWIDRPEFLQSIMPLQPRVPHKYRITVDCAGFNPNSIKTKVSEDKTKLTVTGQEGEGKPGTEDYSMREFKKSYNLPKNVETDKMVSFMTGQGQLVIEMPIRREQHQLALPKLVEENGKQMVMLNVPVPENIDPSHVKVTCKDRDLIVTADEKQEKPDSVSKFHYYSRCRMPENTDFDALKCMLDRNQLSIKAPINPDMKGRHHKNIPIQGISQQGQIKNK
jgi:HSP20 family molecular chaperone IbpA